MRRDGIATALNALSNASRTPVSEADLLPILSTGEGPAHLVRALFEDCSFETLDRVAATLGVSRRTLCASYEHVKRLHGAINAEFDAGARRDKVARHSGRQVMQFSSALFNPKSDESGY